MSDSHNGTTSVDQQTHTPESQSRHAHHHHGGHHEHHHLGGGHEQGGEGLESGSHEHGHKHDAWSGDDYLNQPGLRELAKFSQSAVVYALKEAGMTEEDIKAVNALEVGCGAGAVTQLYSGTFASVHAIDVSASMLTTFSTELPSDKYPNVTHSQHTLSAQSGQQFGSNEPVLSPTKAEPDRHVRLPRHQFDLAVINLVLHHVDDIEGFMKGLKDLIVPGGLVVFTEFTNLHMHRKETAEGSVNAPAHYHHEFNEQSITALLGHFGLEDVHAEIRGEMAIWRDGKFHDVDCLIARAKKPAASA